MTDLRSLNEDFRDLLIAFAEEGVEFVVVGAYALAYHGVPRATGDMDVLVRPDAENSQRVWRGLVRFGAPVVAAGVTENDFVQADVIYQIGLPPRRIDVLTSITGVTFEDAWETKVRTTVDGKTVFFLGRETLIRNKRAAGRAKDLADIEALEQEP